MSNVFVKDLVTVVITNYNYAEYLRQCLESVAVQTYRPLELIIIDDASTDNSWEVIQGLKKDYRSEFVNVSAIHTHSNSKIHGVLNIALRYVRGEITLMLDADDWLEPWHTQVLVDAT